MKITKLIFSAVLLLSNYTIGSSQGFESDIQACMTALISNNNLHLEVDIEVKHPNTKEVLETTTSIVQRNGNITYQKMMDTETILDQELQLVVKVDHDFEVMSIHSIKGTQETLITSISKMLSEMTNYYSDIETSEESNSGIVKYALRKEGKTVCEIDINRNTNRLESMTMYETKKINVHGEMIIPVMSMKYKYSDIQKVARINSYISMNDGYKPKKKYKNYKFYNLKEIQ